MTSNRVEIRQSAVHGEVLSALVAVSPGELCFDEAISFSVATARLPGKPVTRADSMLSMQELDEAAVEDAIQESNMTEDELREFRAFSGSSDLHRFQISSYDMSSTWSQLPAGFGYGRYGSYLNHSCQPKLIYFWHPRVEKMQLRALTEIVPGDELTIDYLASEEWLTHKERKQQLARLLKLDSCACDKCIGQDCEASDERIRKIQQLEETLISSMQKDAINAKTAHLVESYERLVLEEIESSKKSEASRVDPRLANAYRLAAIILNKAGLAEEAAARNNQANMVADMCFGKGDANIGQQELRLQQRLDL